jgi:hypothetical protein
MKLTGAPLMAGGALKQTPAIRDRRHWGSG